MDSRREIVIIGGGVVGLCTAWYALQRGLGVTVLERGGPSHGGCSFGNGGMIVPSHFVPLAAPGMVAYGLRMMLRRDGPFGIRPRPSRDLLRWSWLFMRAARKEHVARAAPVLRDLHLESRQCYVDLESRIGGFGLACNGLLMLCRTEKGLQEEIEAAHLADHLDVPAEVLDPEETARLEPGLEMDIAGAVYYPRDAHLSPNRFMANMVHALQEGGARLLWETRVQGWTVRNGTVEAVRTNRGDFRADEFVLAAGAWSARLARDLGLSLPLQAGKGYSMTLPSPPQCPRACAILTEARVAVTPMDGALRFAGTLEVAGLDTTVNHRRVQGIRKSVERYLPAFSESDFDSAPVWTGLRPCSPDGLPYIGRTARYENLLIGAGHAMMGMSLGPVTGIILAKLASGEASAREIGLLRPDRYG